MEEGLLSLSQRFSECKEEKSDMAGQLQATKVQLEHTEGHKTALEAGGAAGVTARMRRCFQVLLLLEADCISCRTWR